MGTTNHSPPVHLFPIAAMPARLVRTLILVSVLLLPQIALFISTLRETPKQPVEEVSLIYTSEPANSFMVDPDFVFVNESFLVDAQGDEVFFQRVVAELVKTFYIA